MGKEERGKGRKIQQQQQQRETGGNNIFRMSKLIMQTDNINFKLIDTNIHSSINVP